MYLDLRTKILLCVTVSFVMIASDNTGVMRYVLPCMALIPLAAFIILKKYAPSCVFCNDTKGVTNYKGKNVCAACMRELKRL